MLVQQRSHRHLQLWLDPGGGCPLLGRPSKRGRTGKSYVAARATEAKAAGALTHCLTTDPSTCGQADNIKDRQSTSARSTSSSKAPALWVFEPSIPSSLQGSAHLVSLAGSHWQLLPEAGDAAGSGTVQATISNSLEASKASSQLPGLAGASWVKAQQQGFAGQCKDIVGHSIRVWWPADEEFYSGIVTDYYFSRRSSSDNENNADDGNSSPSSSRANGAAAAAELTRQQNTAAVGSKRRASNSAKDAASLQGKHRIQYEDGEVELLDLTAETWHLTDYELQQLETQKQEEAGLSSSSTFGMDVAPLPAAGTRLCSFSPDRPTEDLVVLLQLPAKMAAAVGAKAAGGDGGKAGAPSTSNKGNTGSGGEMPRKPQRRTAPDATAATAKGALQLPSPVDALQQAVMGMKAKPPPADATAPAKAVKAAAASSKIAPTGRIPATAAATPAAIPALKSAAPSPTNNTALPIPKTSAAAAAAADKRTPSPTTSVPGSASRLQLPSTAAAGAPEAAAVPARLATPSPVLSAAHQTPLQQLLKQGMIAGLHALMTGGNSSSTAAAAAGGATAATASLHAGPKSVQAATAAAVAAAMAANASKAAAAAQPITAPDAQAPAQGMPARPSTAAACTPAANNAAATAARHSSSKPPACPKAVTATQAPPTAGLGHHTAAGARPHSGRAGVKAPLLFSSAAIDSHPTPSSPAATPFNNSAVAADTPAMQQQQQVEEVDPNGTEASGAILSAAFSLDADGAAAILRSNTSTSPAATGDSNGRSGAGSKVPTVPDPTTLAAAASTCVDRPSSGTLRAPPARKLPQPHSLPAPAVAAATTAGQAGAGPAQDCWQEVPLLQSDVSKKASSTAAHTADRTPADAAAAATAGASSVSCSARQLLNELLARLEPAAAAGNARHKSSAGSRRQLQAILATDSMQFSLLLPPEPCKEVRSTRSSSSGSGSGGSVQARSATDSCARGSCVAVLLVRLPAGVQPGSMRVQTSSTALQLSYSQYSSSAAVMQYRETVCLPGGMVWTGCGVTAVGRSTRSSKHDAGTKALANQGRVGGSKAGASSTQSPACKSKEQTATGQDTCWQARGCESGLCSQRQDRPETAATQAVALLQVSSSGRGNMLMVLGRCCST